jgi:TPR repeat protein
VLAARQLAAAFARGDLGAVDDSAAVEWWTRAAEAGDAEAQLRLGDAYATGRGVERDIEAARMWYERALERRHPRARAALAQLTP